MARNETSVGYADAINSSRRAKPGPKVVRSIEIEKGEDGGHTVTHRFKQSDGGPYHESEGPHIFGESEGKKLIAHLKEHLQINDGGEEKED